MTFTGMGLDVPSPRLDPNCQCICHRQPGVMHVAACCQAKGPESDPADAIAARDAQLRAEGRLAGLREAAEFVDSQQYAVTRDGGVMEPARFGPGRDQHHATIAKAIRALADKIEKGATE